MFSYYISHPVFPCKEAHNPQQTLVIGQWFSTFLMLSFVLIEVMLYSQVGLEPSNSLCSASPVLILQGGPLCLVISYSNRNIIFSLGI